MHTAATRRQVPGTHRRGRGVTLDALLPGAVGAMVLLAVLMAACAPAAAATPTTAPAAKAAATLAAASQPATGGVVRTKSGYPSRAIDLLVAWGPGGGTDLAGRLLAGYFQQKWGVAINVVNLPGGSGQVGTMRALQATPDGYTMKTETHGDSSLMAAISKNLPFDWRKRTWIARTTIDPVFFSVKADSPWKNLDDVMKAVKADPQKFVWGAAGTTGIGNFGIAQLLASRGVKLTDTNRVTFNSGGEVMTALAGGQIQLAGQQLSEVKPLMAAGRIRVIATVGDKRDPNFPDVPAAREQGYPEVTMFGWHGVSGPSGLPAEIVEFWISEIRKASADPEFARRAADLGKVVAPILGAEFEKYVLDQYQSVQPLAQAFAPR